MNDTDGALEWREMAEHLVQAHGADPDCLIGYAPTQEQLCFAHADTHIALAGEGAHPPDGHVHSLPIDTGWPFPQESSYRPFPPSRGAVDDPFGWPMPHQTGLHHHISRLSGRELDVAGSLLAKQFIRPEDLAALCAAVRGTAWQASVDFPCPVQTWPTIQTSRGGLAASRRAASATRQARPGSLR